MLHSPQAMHIPDGFLSGPVLAVCWGISAIVIIYAFIRVKRDMDERKVPLMGVVAAAIFAGQMLNFPVAAGTSGHLLGAALATILLGPWAAVLIMTIVAGAQALLFADGGLVALGANLLNMAVIGVFVAYTVYRTVQRFSKGAKWGIFVGGFLAAWTSIFIAALAAALELAFSATSPANLAVPAMALVHSVIGIGEGLDHGGRAGLCVCGAARSSEDHRSKTGGRQVRLDRRIVDRDRVGRGLAAGLHTSRRSGIYRRAAGLHQ